MIINKERLGKLKNLENTVFTTGCFNLYHPGHAYFLSRAKDFGDKLIVAVAHDEITKHKRVPVLNQRQRMYIVDSHKYVDYVIAEDNAMPPYNVSTLVMLLKPDVWVTNADNPNLETYYNLIKGTNIHMQILERINDGIFNVSTTSLINKIREGYRPCDVSDIDLAKRYGGQDLI